MKLPSSLRFLSFGDNFNQSLENVALPSSLDTVSFGHNFNQSLKNVDLPSSLKTLSFGHDFNQNLMKFCLQKRDKVVFSDGHCITFHPA